MVEPEGSLVTIAGSEDPGPSPLPLRASACAIIFIHRIYAMGRRVKCDGMGRGRVEGREEIEGARIERGAISY